uniref:hypothetical protein n=1 Tax=uncultured Draconibacterium sp. TaxID=1573823 RepID=UPI003216A3C8
MSKSRKTLIVTFLVLGAALIYGSFYFKSHYNTNKVCCVYAFGGVVMAITALVLTIRKPKFK